MQLVGHVPAGSFPRAPLPFSVFEVVPDWGCTAHPGHAHPSPHVHPSRVISIAVGKLMMLGKTRSLSWDVRVAVMALARGRIEGRVL